MLFYSYKKTILQYIHINYEVIDVSINGLNKENRLRSQRTATLYKMKVIIIIIYHDFLPTLRRGSPVKSGKTHTQSSRYTP